MRGDPILAANLAAAQARVSSTTKALTAALESLLLVSNEIESRFNELAEKDEVMEERERRLEERTRDIEDRERKVREKEERLKETRKQLVANAQQHTRDADLETLIKAAGASADRNRRASVETVQPQKLTRTRQEEDGTVAQYKPRAQVQHQSAPPQLQQQQQQQQKPGALLKGKLNSTNNGAATAESSNGEIQRSKKIVPAPRAKPKPVARALYPFVGELGDLSFEAGDYITIVSKDGDGGWWEGEIDGEIGLFPSNYVEECV